LCLVEKTSPAFQQFLTFLGEKIELKGWKGYRAGLDISEGQTGLHSYYTKWQGYEIMFHVAPLLPMSTADKQQLERKRHVGNDIVVVIFVDSDQTFKLSSISSKQNHVFCFVKPHGDGYMQSTLNKNGVPVYTPELPEPAYYERNAVSRDFFLHKLVNGERASYKSPSFAPKISRTRSVLLYDVAERFSK
jgi:RAP1 GTPase activating protein 1